jgi:hypothetical protein
VAHPRRPGRKAGSAYGRRAHRQPPAHIDETYEARLPPQCPHCQNALRLRRIARQSQEELPVHRPLLIRVVNGDRSGQNRLTSGSITFNDVVVLDASQLTSATEFVEITNPNLPVENTYVVSLTGDPGATILVKVSDSTVR